MVVLVTSFHRSYTSLTCQWLDRCGVEFPGPLMGAGVGNDHGHFEHLPLLHLVNQVVRKEISETQAAIAFKSMVTDELCDREVIYGFKAPDAVLFAKELLAIGAVDQLLMPIRSFEEVMDSLEKRRSKQLSSGFFRFSRFKQRFFIQFVFNMYHRVIWLRKWRRSYKVIKEITGKPGVSVLDFNSDGVWDLTLKDVTHEVQSLDTNIPLGAVRKL